MQKEFIRHPHLHPIGVLIHAAMAPSSAKVPWLLHLEFETWHVYKSAWQGFTPTGIYRTCWISHSTACWKKGEARREPASMPRGSDLRDEGLRRHQLLESPEVNLKTTRRKAR